MNAGIPFAQLKRQSGRRSSPGFQGLLEQSVKLTSIDPDTQRYITKRKNANQGAFVISAASGWSFFGMLLGMGLTSGLNRWPHMLGPKGMRIEGTIGLNEGSFTAEVRATSLFLSLEWYGDKIEMDIQVQQWPSSSQQARRLPRGTGRILLNGTCIANYVSSAVVMNTGRNNTILLQQDTFARRYLWARQYSISLIRSLQYAWGRRFVISSDKWLLASFCGDIGRVAMLNHSDAEQVAQLPMEEQAAVVALGYLWNLCSPSVDAFLPTAIETGVASGSVANIPSFRVTEEGWDAQPEAGTRRRCAVVRYFYHIVMEGGWLLILMAVLLAAALSKGMDMKRWDDATRAAGESYSIDGEKLAQLIILLVSAAACYAIYKYLSWRRARRRLKQKELAPQPDGKPKA